jgi:hypothetical protein
MSGLQRLVVCACGPLAVVLASMVPTRPAHAQSPGSLDIAESIDDPKLERRLGTRIELVASAAPAYAVPAETQLPAADVGTVAPLPRADAVATPPRPAGAGTPRVPHLKIGYRWLTLAQLAAGAVPGRGADETFHVVSLDFYPISSIWRLGLSTQYGWESGTFRANGDAFFAQSVSLGFQIPGQVFTPFLEGHAGAGFMQRMHEPKLPSPATAYVQLGVDLGTEIFLARYAYLSLALGYVHASNYFAGTDPKVGLAPTTLSLDTFSIKVGFGI